MKIIDIGSISESVVSVPNLEIEKIIKKFTSSRLGSRKEYVERLIRYEHCEMGNDLRIIFDKIMGLEIVSMFKEALDIELSKVFEKYGKKTIIEGSDTILITDKVKKTISETFFQKVPLENTSSMFGPLYHGTTELDMESILDHGFSVIEGEIRTDKKHGLRNNIEEVDGKKFRLPCDFLGFGVYMTKSKTNSNRYGKNFNKRFYLDTDKILKINFASFNRIAKWWIENGYDPELSMKDRVEATRKMTSRLSSKYDAVWFSGKGYGRLLDGDQVVIFNKDVIRIVEEDVVKRKDVTKIGDRIKSNSFYDLENKKEIDGDIDGVVVRRMLIPKNLIKQYGGNKWFFQIESGEWISEKSLIKKDCAPHCHTTQDHTEKGEGNMATLGHFLKEATNKSIELKKFLQDDKPDPVTYQWMIHDWIKWEKENNRDAFGVELYSGPKLVIPHDAYSYEKLPEQAKKSFVEFLNTKRKKGKGMPTSSGLDDEQSNLYFTEPDHVNSNEWLIHFTDNFAVNDFKSGRFGSPNWDRIITKGFIKGTDKKFLHATKHGGVDKSGNWGFAFLVSDLEKDEGIKRALYTQSYGVNAIMFKSNSAVVAKHTGDYNERQVIFDIGSARDLVPILYRDNLLKINFASVDSETFNNAIEDKDRHIWFIPNPKHINDKPIVKSRDFFKIVKWVESNHGQYLKVINSILGNKNYNQKRNRF
jgi:hypothetical protein